MTDPNDVYDRLQEKVDLEDMDDGVIEALLLENFTNRKTNYSGTVDLTSDHTRNEWRDSTHKGEKRVRKVKGFTPRLSGLVKDIGKIRDENVQTEIAKQTKPLSMASIERGEADKILNNREKELEKWRKVRTDTDELIRDNVTVYRNELAIAEKETKNQLKEQEQASKELQRELNNIYKATSEIELNRIERRIATIKKQGIDTSEAESILEGQRVSIQETEELQQIEKNPDF